MNWIKATIIAGAGGFVGTCMRFLSEKFGAAVYGGAFPLGTFIANILGCLLIGIFYGWASNRAWFNKKWNLFLITGLCGGFTTFSSLSDECTSLIDAGNDATFWLYLLASLVLGVLAVAAGIAMVPKKAAGETA